MVESLVVEGEIFNSAFKIISHHCWDVNCKRISIDADGFHEGVGN